MTSADARPNDIRMWEGAVTHNPSPAQYFMPL